MTAFASFFRFYINSSVHVALAVVSLTLFTSIEYHISIDYSLLLFLFFSTITGYNFVKYAPVAKLHHRKLTNRLKLIQIFSFFIFLGLIISLFYISSEVIIISSVLGVLTILYAVPIGRKNLRQIGLFKIFIIALIWSTSTFVLPFLNENKISTHYDLLWCFSFIERGIWVLLIMIPFEIRDVEFDKSYYNTVISKFGIVRVKIASCVLALVLCCYKIIILESVLLWVYVIIYTSLIISILYSKAHQHRYYSSFWVESLPIFWLFSLMLLI